ncbi:MAG: hypothetical protein ABH826_01170 [Patescibacteria group bacterium]
MRNNRLAEKRPPWVWMISGFYFFSAMWSSWVLSGRISITDAQRAYCESLTVFDYVLTLTIDILNFAGAISLFRLKKVAFPLFLIAFFLSMLFRQIISKGWGAAFGVTGSIGTIICYGILLLACVYTKKLIKDGVLQ